MLGLELSNELIVCLGIFFIVGFMWYYMILTGLDWNLIGFLLDLDCCGWILEGDSHWRLSRWILKVDSKWILKNLILGHPSLGNPGFEVLDLLVLIRYPPKSSFGGQKVLKFGIPKRRTT